MKDKRRTGIVWLTGIVFLTLVSCQKKEQPVVLPAVNASAAVGAVKLGADYQNQVFYDLESRTVVKTSEVASWDLAFEASPRGYHVFMNGGKGIYTFNTSTQDFDGAYLVPGGMEYWDFDRPCGLPDSTGIGEWCDSSTLQSYGDVYLIRLNENDIRKLQILRVSETEYQVNYGDLYDQVPQIITIPKDDRFNYTYISFRNGLQVVQPEPPKDSWDIVFTRYRYIYYFLDNFPYEINGALLNPYQTTAARDSVSSFESIGPLTSQAMTFSNHRDVIGGFGWKNYNFSTGRYEVNQKMNYVVNTRKGQQYKLHFIDFYSTAGEKGCPSFEFARIR